MSVNIYYANGRIAVLSTKLFGAEKFTRIAESTTVEEALKALFESSYGNGTVIDNANDYEVLLKAELSNTVDLVKELSTNQYVTRYFLSKYDYLNAKVLMKCKYMRVDGSENCFECASVPVEVMQKAINEDEYKGFSPFMAKALEYIDEQFSLGNRSPRVIDVTLDKAYYSELANAARKSKLATLAAYHKYDVDTVNLLTLYRAKKAGFDKQAYVDMVVDGGTIASQTLQKVWDTTENGKVYDMVGETYKKFAKVLLEGYETGSLAKAEEFANAHKHALLTQNPDTLTIAPLIAYFKNKTDEIDKIRFAFIGIKNDVDKETIKERLKGNA